MQEPKARRSNADRTSETRRLLVQTSRSIFVEKGYAETSTPEIVAKAGITRGALYHHFEDKSDLFRAVVVAESEAIGALIEEATKDCADARHALEVGAEAYLDAVAVPGRIRLLLLDGPAVLGRLEMDRIDEQASGGTIADGLSAVIGQPIDATIAARARLLSAAFDRAALEIANGGDRSLYLRLLKQMLLEACRSD